MQGELAQQPLCKHFVIKINHLRHLHVISDEISYTEFKLDWMSGRYLLPEVEIINL